MTLILVLADAALQRVPDEIRSHPQIKQYASRRGKAPEEVLLDRTFHHSAMKDLARTHHGISPEKMGRPDIVHNTLLQILETPLNWENNLKVIIHTQDEHVIGINPKIRLPKNYIRFVGLIEQLFKEKRIPQNGEPLLTIKRAAIQQMVKSATPTRTVGFSTLGRPKLLRNVASSVASLEKPMVLIGAFPRGHFSEGTKRILDETYKIDSHSLDAWVVAGRFIYDFEWSIGLAQNRVEQ
jgi:rRNA small subunit pseudouridine methyltransferase Nep1